MNGDLLTRLTGLRAWLSPRPFVAVAYSGGVDSSLLLKVAWDTLGERCCAILAVSPSLPGSEREAAAGLDTQAKVLTCPDFEIRVFAGGQGGSLNNVMMSDSVAARTLRERRVKARGQAGQEPKP